MPNAPTMPSANPGAAKLGLPLRKVQVAAVDWLNGFPGAAT